MPKSILNCSLIANQGKYNFDPVSKVLYWDVGRIDVTKLPNIRGTVCFLYKKKCFLFQILLYELLGFNCEWCESGGN